VSAEEDQERKEFFEQVQVKAEQRYKEK